MIYSLKVEEPEDLSRDVLKSETCALRIPELDLESGGIAISGKFTTVEGLILDIKNIVIIIFHNLFYLSAESAQYQRG